MLDLNTFLTTLYVMGDTFCNTLPPESQPGPAASLTRSKVLTLDLVGQWARFGSARDFYRFAEQRLRAAFPTLPERSQFNRLRRRHRDAVRAFAVHLVDVLGTRQRRYEALRCSGVATRHAKRRGAGWLPGMADSGWSNRLGWDEGVHVLMAVTPDGARTGVGVGAASTKDQPLADTFFAVRHTPQAGLVSAGQPACGPYVVDTGGAGDVNQHTWATQYHAQVICPPRRTSHRRWPKAWRRWHASIRPIVETVYDKVHYTFRLAREQPHDLTGFQARLAAKVALHNFCIWFNQRAAWTPTLGVC